MKKNIATLLIISSLTISFHAKCEEADFYIWLMRMSNITFSTGGGAFLPIGVLRAMQYGNISPIMQFVMMNHTMNECIKAILKAPFLPLQRDPYLVAKKKFDYGVCRIKKCWQNGMLIQMLPLMKSDFGGSSQMGMLLAQAFQRDEACDGGEGGGFDPILIGLLIGK